MKETGLTHIYFGNGKGKTTTGMGLAVRAAGYGYKVLIYQFMKDNFSSERKVLDAIPNITLVEGLEKEKFSSQMTAHEKEQRRDFYLEQFRKVIKKAEAEMFDLLFLDEIIYTISAGLLEEAAVLDFLKEKPRYLEVILTGNKPGDNLIEMADYVSEIRKIKHPFEKGKPARDGIEK